MIRLAEGLSPENVPHVLISRERELRYLESLTLEWGIWAHPSSPVGAATAADLRAPPCGYAAGAWRRFCGGRDGRIKRYLSTHPYVSTLELNLVHPGAGELLLEVLLSLQSDQRAAEIRYVIRLVRTELSRSRVGAALDSFMADPQAVPGGARTPPTRS